MTRIIFEVPDFEHQQFKRSVGENNISSTLRNFIKSFIETGGKEGVKEWQLRKKFDKMKKEKEFRDKEYSQLKAKLDIIDSKKEQEEEKRRKFVEEQKENVRQAEGRALKDNMHRMI